MKIRILFPVVLLFIAACSRYNDRVIPKCYGLADPVGILPENVVFSWEIISGDYNVRQTDYHILVSSSKSLLEKESGDIWDTKKVNGNNLNLKFTGSSLKPDTEYWWKVKIWNNKGKESEWSKPARFITGLWEPGQWKGARWIGLEQMPDSLRFVPGLHESQKKLFPGFANKRTIVPLIRKEFKINRKISKAILNICGLGHYELYINGKKPENRFLAPGWTDYDKTCQYNTYDLTGILNTGINTIGVIVGNGFYTINRERYWKLVITYGYPKMILVLNVQYENGANEYFISDETWKTKASPTTFSSIYGGEDYDARLEEKEWTSAGFNDSNWKNVLLVNAPGGKLVPETDHPLKVMEKFHGKKIHEFSETHYLYDFGQNASGIIHIWATGPKGAAIHIRPGECLTGDSLVIQKGSPYLYNYTLSGDGIEEWEPKFSYYGFRYAEVEYDYTNSDTKNAINLQQVSLLHTRNSSPETGSFECSEKLFNRIFNLIKWAMKSNMASVLTDCPHREKLGWLEVDHLMCSSILYNYDAQQFFNKIIADMKDSQLENGLVPDIAPEYVEFIAGFRDSPEWGCSSVLLPWQIYQFFGDKAVLVDSYDMMKKYAMYLKSKSKDHIVDHGLGDWYDLGPGHPGPSQLTPRALTATAIYYDVVKTVEKTSRLLERNNDIEYFSKLKDSIAVAFNSRFFDSEKGIYATGSQTAYSIPLNVGLVPADRKEQVLENFKQSIIDNEYGLTAGDIGFHYVVRTLSETGNSEILYKMNNRTDRPGYGYQLKMGATSLTESWAALTEPSHNHLMLGHLMEWFYTGLAGIRQEENSLAFENIIVAPDPVGEINWARASVKCLKGKISVDWKIEENDFYMETEIPVNSDARIIIPGKFRQGKCSILNDKGKPADELVKKINDYEFIVGSGKYKIFVRK